MTNEERLNNRIEYITTHYGWALKKLAEGPDAETEESEGEDSPSEENKKTVTRNTSF